MKNDFPEKLMRNWTPQQVLAVYDFCRLMSDAIWQQHEDTLLNQMVAEDHQSAHELDDTRSDNLELPFNDVEPF